MKKITRPRLTQSLALLTIIVCLLSCNKVGFNNNPTPAQNQDNTTATPITPTPVTPTPDPVTPPDIIEPPPCDQIITHIPTKVLFIVDMSSSNQGVSFGTKYQPGTDDNKVMRAGVISTFLSHYQNNANFSWGFVTFNDTTARSLIPGLSSKQIFTNNPNKMHTAITDFQKISDQGDTPYKAALKLAYQGVLNDPDLKSPDKPNYIVVFLSDGRPSDYSLDQSGQLQMEADVKKITALSPKQVSFNSIYYGFYDMVASNRLKQMSVAGRGVFLDTNLNPDGKDFKINDLIIVPGSNCN